jgi:hypothetical protein
MKRQLSKPARGHARCTDEYKEQALPLWRASGRGAAKVAAESDVAAVVWRAANDTTGHLRFPYGVAPRA